MSQVTLRPNAVIKAGGGTPSVGTIASVLADDSDSTYVTLAKGGQPSIVGLGTTPPPTNSVLKSIRLRARYGSDTANPTRLRAWVRIGSAQWSKIDVHSVVGSSIIDQPAAAVYPGNLSQAQINDLQVAFACPDFAWDPCRLYEIYVDLVFQETSTVTVDALTTVTSSDFTISWDHTAGTDGGPQYRARVKVFTAAQVGTSGFDAWLSPAVVDSGIIYGSQSSYDVTGLGEGDYYQYVWTAQEWNGSPYWGASPASDAFTVDLTAPEVADVSAAVINDQGAVEIVVDRDTGGEAWAKVLVERSSSRGVAGDIGRFLTGSGGLGTGWTTYTSGAGTVTPTLETSSSWNGTQYQRWVGSSSGAGWSGIEWAEAHPVVGGETYALALVGNWTVSGSGISFWRFVYWFDAAGNSLGSSNLGVSGSSSSWAPRELDVVAPAAARLAKVQLLAGFGSGGSGSWTVNVDDVRLVPYNDQWVRVRNDELVTPGADQVTFIDWEAPPGLPLRYRAWAIDSNGHAGPKTTSTDAPEWDMDDEGGIWLKSLANPERSARFRLGQAPAAKRRQRRGVFDVLGAKHSVSTYDVRSAREIPFVLRTANEDEAEALAALVEEGVVLIHAPSSYRLAAGYWQLGDLEEVHLNDHLIWPEREWVFDAVEVDRP